MIKAGDFLQRGTSPDTVRRLGQALWMQIGTRLDHRDLVWSRNLLGQRGEEALWDELVRHGALTPPDFVLQPDGLSSFLCDLADPSRRRLNLPRLVWTLPTELGLPDTEGGYCDAAIEMISAAQRSLWLISPFIEERGIGRLLDPLLVALSRNVRVHIVAHGIGSLADSASGAVETLRREAGTRTGTLTVYVVDPTVNLLVHSKLIVADTLHLLIGSANLTDRGLGSNFEAGVVMGEPAPSEVIRMLGRLMDSGILREAFSTRGNPT